MLHLIHKSNGGAMAKMPLLRMNTGAEIPQVGFGLWRNEDAHMCIDSVKAALDAGYSHFDDAQVYNNEEHLGQALQEAGAAREQLFITTKIATENMWWTDVVPTFEASL